ncbi:MAG: nuclear transport factor 2 family protein [Candidatus Aminicenantes bacterium]|nr:nuclear transport factor 2 family protein [Candidatus Aminicenantes bacterium]
MKRTVVWMIAIMLLIFSILATGALGSDGNDTETDKEAIKKAALDYIEGWYEGNAERMERALHPDLAKRGLFVDPETGKTVMRSVGAADMVKYTEAGAGKSPEKKDKIKLDILDMYKNTACVKLVSPDYVDYLHLGRFEGKWVIVNVIWEMNK